MTNKQYDYIYIFENRTVVIFEIKLKNTIVNDQSKLYKWFLYEKENDMLQPLSYESRKNENNIEFRTFETSILWFDNNKAIYRNNDNDIELKRLDIKLPVDDKIKELVDDYFYSLEMNNN